MARIELLSPVPSVDTSRARLIAPLRTFAGKRIGFRAEWDNFHEFCDFLWARLEAAGEVAGTARWETSFARAGEEAKLKRAADLERFAASVDAAVVGLAA